MASKQWAATDPDSAYEGNNAAFVCPHCKHVFIISAAIHPTKGGTQGRDGQRACPSCGKSTGHVAGGRNSGGKAWLDF